MPNFAWFGMNLVKSSMYPVASRNLSCLYVGSSAWVVRTARCALVTECRELRSGVVALAMSRNARSGSFALLVTAYASGCETVTGLPPFDAAGMSMKPTLSQSDCTGTLYVVCQSDHFQVPALKKRTFPSMTVWSKIL